MRIFVKVQSNKINVDGLVQAINIKMAVHAQSEKHAAKKVENYLRKNLITGCKIETSLKVKSANIRHEYQLCIINSRHELSRNYAGIRQFKLN